MKTMVLDSICLFIVVGGKFCEKRAWLRVSNARVDNDLIRFMVRYVNVVA